MKKSLKTKILEIYSMIWIPFLFVLIVAFYLVLSMQLDKLAVEKLKSDSYNSQLYAIRYMQMLDSDNYSAEIQNIASHFAKYMASDAGVRVQIYSAGSLLADSSTLSGELPETGDIARAQEYKAYTFFYYKGLRYISFSSPIISTAADHRGTSVGVIRYVYPMRDERFFIMKVLGFVLLLSVVILLVNMALSRKLAGKITESVRSLEKAALYIQSGDEVEELGYAFNSMRKRLKEYIGRLDSQSTQM